MFADVADKIEFFDLEDYCRYMSVAENIAFGAAVDKDFDQEHLHNQPKFIEFLESHNLMAHLVVLGETLARVITDELGPEPAHEDFKSCPIPEAEYNDYQKAANRLDSGEPLSAEEKGLILKLALGFIPGIHDQIELDPAFANRVVVSRQDFMALVKENFPDSFCLLRAGQVHREPEHPGQHPVRPRGGPTPRARRRRSTTASCRP